MRLVHQTPQYDARGQASNFFVDQTALAVAVEEHNQANPDKRISVRIGLNSGDVGACNTYTAKANLVR